MLAAAGLLALLTPAAGFAVLCWWVLVARLMPGATWFRRLCFAVVALYALNATVLSALEVLGLACDPRVLLALYLLSTLARATRSHSRRQVPFVSKAESLALGFGVLTGLVLILPFLKAGPGRTMSLLAQDGATHVQLTVAIARHHGYVHLLHPRGLSPTMDTYPTGWHGNVWLNGQLLLGTHLSPITMTRLVASAAVLTYTYMSTLAAVLVLELGKDGVRSRIGSACGLTILGLATITGFVVILFQLGSYTQLFAIAALLALLLLALEPPDGMRSLLVIAACVIGLTQSWYFLAPLIVVAAAVVLRSLRPRTSHVFALVGATIPASLYPLLTGPGPHQVDAAGATLLPTLPGVIGLLAATGIGLAAGQRESDRRHLPLVATATTALVMTVCLVVLQGFQPGSGVSYYGAKLLLTVFVFGLLLSAVLVARTVRSSSNARLGLALFAGLGVALSTLSTASIAIAPFRRTYQGHADAAVLSAIFRDHPTGAEPGTRTWILDDCDRLRDRVGTKWLYDTSLAWTTSESDDLAEYALTAPGDVSMVERLLKDPATKSFEIYVHHACDPEALHKLAIEPKVRVIHVS